MAQIDRAGQQDTDNQNAEALQAALAQRQVTLQGQPQGGSDVPYHENSDPVSDESEILRSRQPLTGKRRVPWCGWQKACQRGLRETGCSLTRQPVQPLQRGGVCSLRGAPWRAPRHGAPDTVNRPLRGSTE